ncbi:MAG: competence protein ComFB [Kiritimatiellia bacterium]|jgi:competence protein ComFB
MLMSRLRATRSTNTEVASVHNYYERLVSETIYNTDPRAQSDPDFMADVSCVALNHLPPRYIRHDVDMSFFMSPVEREETAKKVQEAVNLALKFVLKHEQEKMNANKESDDKAEANEDLNAIAPDEDKEDSNDSDPAH